MATFPDFRCLLTSFNIIIAKWGDDRKSAFRLGGPPKKNPVAFQTTGNFQRPPEIWRFRLGGPRKNISGDDRKSEFRPKRASADSPGAISIGKNNMILNMGRQDHTKMLKQPWVFKLVGRFDL